MVRLRCVFQTANSAVGFFSAIFGVTGAPVKGGLVKASRRRVLF
jgi:hypothetical protein